MFPRFSNIPGALDREGNLTLEACTYILDHRDEKAVITRIPSEVNLMWPRNVAAQFFRFLFCLGMQSSAENRIEFMEDLDRIARDFFRLHSLPHINSKHWWKYILAMSGVQLLPTPKFYGLYFLITLQNTVLE